MHRIEVTRGSRIVFGHVTDNDAYTLVFDVSDILRDFGHDGFFNLINRRSKDRPAESYLVPVVLNGSNVEWTISSADVAFTGYGECQLQYVVGETVVNTDIWQTVTKRSLIASGEVPEPYEVYVVAVGRLAQEAKDAASASALSANQAQTYASNALGNANAAKKAAEDAHCDATYAKTASDEAISAKNSAEDFSKKADEALQELKDGIAHGDFKGEPGKDGYTPVKGVDYFDGKDGAPGEKGDPGYTPVKGVDYFDGATGPQGPPGYTPVKGIDYFDGSIGPVGPPGYTPVKGVDYFDGKDGSDATVTKASVNEALGFDVKESFDTLKSESEAEDKKLSDSIEELRLFKFPNATIVGEPLIDNGQVSRFSNVNFLVFPFIVDVRDKNFEINFCFTTGSDVTTQQNILDSAFGLALAIRNSKGVMALSSNGTSFNLGESVGTRNIQPNQTYYAKLEFDGTTYTTKLSQDMVTYVEDMRVVASEGLFPTQIYIGGSPDLFGAGTAHPFKGSINLNRCSLMIAGLDVWQGMDDAGLASRANVSLSNLDTEGEARFTEIHETLTVQNETFTQFRSELDEHDERIEELDEGQKFLKAMSEDNLYSYEEVESEAYSVEVPSGSRLASVQKIGGKSIVWNQLISVSNTADERKNGVTYINNHDGSWSFNGTAESNSSKYIAVIPMEIKKGHKYLLLGCEGSTNAETIRVWFNSSNAFPAGHRLYHGLITEASEDEVIDSYSVYVYKGNTANNITWKPQLFDLTAIGIEEITVGQFEDIFVKDYYPYSNLTLQNAEVENVVAMGKNMVFVVDIIAKYFPTGMKSAGIIYDELDFTRGIAVRRVGVVDLGTIRYQIYNVAEGTMFRTASNTVYPMGKPVFLTGSANRLCSLYTATTQNRRTNKTISANGSSSFDIIDNSYSDSTAFATAMNGVLLYYELETPIETPIDAEDLEILRNLAVEEGGSITFEQEEIHLPIPNSIEYLVKNQLAKLSDLPNFADYVKSTDYASGAKGGVVLLNNCFNASQTNGGAYCTELTLEQYNARSNVNFIGKGTLENIKESLVKSVVDKPFELVDTIVLANDTDEFIASVEPNGKPYAFKKMVVQIEFPAASTAQSGYAGAYVTINNSSSRRMIGLVQSHIATSKKYWACRAYIDSGMLFGYSMNMSATGNANAQPISTTTDGTGSVFAEYITSFVMRKGSVGLLSGTVIKVYAVRA